MIVFLYDMAALAIRLRVSLQGGTRLVYQIDVSRFPRNPLQTSREVKRVIASRLQAYGMRYATVELVGDDRLEIMIPGAEGLVKKQIEQMGNLRLQIVETSKPSKDDIERYTKEETDYVLTHSQWAESYREWKTRKDASPSLTEKAPVEPSAPEYVYRQIWERKSSDGGVLEEAQPREAMILLNRSDSVIEGSLIKTASWTIDESGNPAVAVTMSSAGATKLSELTNAHIDDLLAIVLDEQVIFAAIIRSRIGEKLQITGNFTAQEVSSLVTTLRGGCLPTKPIFVSTSKIDSLPFRPTFSLLTYSVLVCLGFILPWITRRRVLPSALRPGHPAPADGQHGIMKSPLSVTIIAWWFIAAGGVSLIMTTATIDIGKALESISESQFTIPVQIAITYIGSLIVLVSGMAILEACNWARLLYVISSVIGLSVGIVTSSMKAVTIFSFVVFLMTTFFLFRPKANRYFSASMPANDASGD